MKCPRCGKDNPPSIHTCSLPEALALAEYLDDKPDSNGHCRQAAAELRRLHEAHEWQYTMAGERLRRIEKLEAEVHAWVKENSPGGWIDNLRVDNEALREALTEERRVRLLGQEPDVHWESMRDIRRACYAATDAALTGGKT